MVPKALTARPSIPLKIIPGRILTFTELLADRRAKMPPTNLDGVENISSRSIAIPKNLKLRAYNAMIKPLLVYGCEIWTLTSSLEKSVQRFERKIVHMITEIRVLTHGEERPIKNYLQKLVNQYPMI
ncbi:unnamed protein product [Nezara viridula]|uniref:Endonuclease-reverse transcriptase n=1 Tax=Nezara viridula TaxID=85310 RepID=A0A9P0HEQ3_NEZVI|nr:unnamed protein product [Nezara viridula]